LCRSRTGRTCSVADTVPDTSAPILYIFYKKMSRVFTFILRFFKKLANRFMENTL
jgi:hypothetical protein